MGSGTTARAAFKHNRNCLGIEISENHIKNARNSLKQLKNEGVQLTLDELNS